MRSAARAYQLAPQRILAYNSRLERHHLGLNLPSLPVLAGSADRSHLSAPALVAVAEARALGRAGRRSGAGGRACSDEHRRVAVHRPYFSYSLAHGGAVRIYHLVRQMAGSLMWSCSRFRTSLCRPRPLRSWSSAPV